MKKTTIYLTYMLLFPFAPLNAMETPQENTNAFACKDLTPRQFKDAVTNALKTKNITSLEQHLLNRWNRREAILALFQLSWGEEYDELIFELLKKYGININRLSARGYNGLMEAVISNDIKKASWFIKKGINIHFVTEENDNIFSLIDDTELPEPYRTEFINLIHEALEKQEKGKISAKKRSPTNEQQDTIYEKKEEKVKESNQEKENCTIASNSSELEELIIAQLKTNELYEISSESELADEDTTTLIIEEDIERSQKILELLKALKSNDIEISQKAILRANLMQLLQKSPRKNAAL